MLSTTRSNATNKSEKSKHKGEKKNKHKQKPVQLPTHDIPTKTTRNNGQTKVNVTNAKATPSKRKHRQQQEIQQYNQKC